MDRYLPRYARSMGDRFAVARQASRYDLVLLVIPAAFLCSWVLGTALAVEPVTVLAGASVLSTLAVIDALFLNPPRGPRTGPRPS